MNELPKPIKIDENAARQDEFLTPYVEGVARQQLSEVRGRTSEIAMLVVFFEAGSRNRPHTHEHDQTLLVLSGRTMVATETEKYVLSAGEVITVPANIWHWHGATLMLQRARCQSWSPARRILRRMSATGPLTIQKVRLSYASHKKSTSPVLPLEIKNRRDDKESTD